MSMDFRKSTYRPNRPDNRFRTSYSLMSQWMTHIGSRNRPMPPPEFVAYGAVPTSNLKHSAGNIYGRKSRMMVNASGAPNPYADQMPDEAQLAAIDEDIPLHMRYSHNSGYDDFHKAFRQVSSQWPNKSFPLFGPPRLRQGRAGGSWRHVKEVLQAGGSRIVFVDGQIAYEDTIKIDDVPKGHLIKADAHSLVDGQPLQRSASVRESRASKKINATRYGVTTKHGLEQGNWAVIR